MKRHTRRPPPTCKSSWRQGRITPSPTRPFVLAGFVRWLDATVLPPIDVSLLIDVYAQPGPTEFFGSTSAPGVTLTLSLNTNLDPALYDVVLTVRTPTHFDDDSWHDLIRPQFACDWDTGRLSHVHVPGVDENDAQLSL